MFYTHMLLLLTQFYLYCKTSIFAALILGYNGIIVKVHLQTKRKADPMPRKENTTHPTDKFGSNPTMAVLQAHQETYQVKAVARRARQGVASPPLALLGPTLLWRFINAM